MSTRKPASIKRAQRPALAAVPEPPAEATEPPSNRPLSRQGKVNLSFWIDENTRNLLDIVWRKKGIRRTQDGMAEMVNLYLKANGEAR